jgi:cytidine deaminase
MHRGRDGDGEFSEAEHMDAREQRDLIVAAERLLRPHRVGDRLFGDVAAIVQTPSGSWFGGACIDTASGTGFCAEQAAVAAMVTAGEYQAAAVVAVWRDENGRLYVLPPCGRCREFLRQVDPANLDTLVLLGNGRALPLGELLPEHEWPRPEQ